MAYCERLIVDPSPAAAASRYTRGPLIGRGADATVYRAFDREIARDVALKVFHGTGGDALLRLKTEFRSLRGVAHPNLVQLYELVVTPEESFFSMELVADGSDIVRYVRGGLDAGEPLDESGIRRLRTSFAQVFDGLLALHGAGLLHRDLKPSNVLVAPGGRAVLLDFGFATWRRIDGAANPGEFAGTPAYTAPEVFRGEGSTAASDAYSAGMLLVEALTGTIPSPALSASLPDSIGRLKGEAHARSWPEDLVDLAAALLAPSAEARTSIESARATVDVERTKAPVSWPRFALPFVGRRRELEWLDERMLEARGGGTVLAVVHGESGIGKTELVRHFLDGLERSDVLLLSGGCRPRESVPYNALDGPADQLSGCLLHGESVPGIPADAADALLRLFPVLERVPGLVAIRRPAPSLSPRELARRAFAALAQVLRTLAVSRPIVVWIDDAQWGDQDSAFGLREILAQGVPRLLLLATCRPGRDEGIVRSLREGGTKSETLELGPLPASDCRELASLLLPDHAGDVALETVTARSEGSPFVLQELANQVDREGLDSVSGGIARAAVARVDAVASGAQSIARIVALAGAGIRIQEILALADTASNEALLYRMQEARLLRSSASRSTGLEIYHDRIRDAVLEAMPRDERRSLHRRIAEVVRRRLEPDAAMLVEHYIGCDDRREAAEWAVVAAEEAERGLAFARAAELWRLALQLRARGRDDWELTARLGQAVAFAGDRVGGGKILGDAAAASEDSDASRTDIIRLRADAARELLCGGEVDGGLDALRRMVRAAGFRYPRTPRHALLELLALRAGLALRGLEFRERPEGEIPVDRLERIDACWTGIIGLNSFDAIRSATFQARHTFLALAAGEPKRVARALTLEAAYRAVEGSNGGRRKAWRLLERVDALAHRLDDPRTTAFAHLCASVAHYFAGQWDQAFERASAGEQVFSRIHHSSWERAMCRMYRLWSDAWRGDTASLRHEQAAALDAAQASEDWLDGIIAASGHANLRWLLDDDPAEARRRAEEAIARFPDIGFQSPHYADLIAQTRIDLYEGLGWQAWARVQRAWPRLRSAQILRMQLFRIELRHLRALAALAAAGSADVPPRELRRWRRERLRRVAANEAQRLRREDLAIAAALGMTIDAGLAESPTDAKGLLREAADTFARAGAGLHVEALSTRGAELPCVRMFDERSKILKRHQFARLVLPPTVQGKEGSAGTSPTVQARRR